METTEQYVQPSMSAQKLMPVGMLFRNAWNLYTERIVNLTLVALVPAVVYGLGQLASLMGGSIVGGVISVIGSILFIPAMAASIFVLDKGTAAGQAFRDGINLFLPLAWIAILTTLIVIGGFVLLIIPGIIMSIWFIFSHMTVVLEDKRGLIALQQSREYVKGYWWAILGRYFLLSLVATLPLYILVGILVAVFGASVAPLYALLNVFTFPFILSGLYTIYINVKSVKPELLGQQPIPNRGLYVTTSIIGFLAPIVFIGAILVLLSQFFLVGADNYEKQLRMQQPTTAPTQALMDFQ